MNARSWAWLLVMALPVGVSASTLLPAGHSGQTPVAEREGQAWKIPVRSADFADVPHTSARSLCEDTRPPEALTTPDPLLSRGAVADKVSVSFIVGVDGRVHSPLILESAGPAGDRNILQTVRAWRYRPATCNGVPTESEAKIEFSRQ